MSKSHLGALEPLAHIDHVGGWHWRGVGGLLVECRESRTDTESAHGAGLLVHVSNAHASVSSSVKRGR